jgi:hypothetical protein
MGEKIAVHDSPNSAEVNPPLTDVATLHEINDDSIGDIELEQLVEGAIDRKVVLDQDDEHRARYILKTILTVIGSASDIEALVDEDNKLIAERRSDAEYTARVDLRVKHAEHWLIWHSEQYGSIQTGEKLLEDVELIKQDWPPTNLYRAFEILARRVKRNHTDQFANAVIKAHRLAIIMMAQATSEYTKMSE